MNVGALKLHHPDGQVFSFDPGTLSLAFAVTGSATNDARFETLNAPEDLQDWAANVVGVPNLEVTRDGVQQAKRLRSATWGSVEAVIDRRPIGVSDLSTINETARPPSLVAQLASNGRLAWLPGATAEGLLSMIARDAIDVLGGPAAGRLRQCEASNCLLLFLDTSRAGRRRWCSMERCGNRAKVSAHRRRRRAPSEQTDKEVSRWHTVESSS